MGRIFGSLGRAKKVARTAKEPVLFSAKLQWTKPSEAEQRNGKKQLKKKTQFQRGRDRSNCAMRATIKHCQNQNMPKFRWRTLQEAKYSPTGKTISADEAGERQIIRH
jgi:hypothetical protein